MTARTGSGGTIRGASVRQFPASVGTGPVSADEVGYVPVGAGPYILHAGRKTLRVLTDFNSCTYRHRPLFLLSRR